MHQSNSKDYLWFISTIQFESFLSFKRAVIALGKWYISIGNAFNIEILSLTCHNNALHSWTALLSKSHRNSDFHLDEKYK